MNQETEFLRGGFTATRRDAGSQRLTAALLDAARAIHAARTRIAPSTEGAALLDRCEILLQRARAAAEANLRLLARDCLYQIERELVAAMDESERRAAFACYRAECDGVDAAWSRALGLPADRTTAAAASVADVQALMRVAHDARIGRLHRLEAAHRKVVALTTLLIAAVLFFAGWSLAGGFEWIVNDEVDPTLAMMLVNGVLFGFLGGLLSVTFSLLGPGAARPSGELRGRWVTTVARPFVGAAVAIPIALFLQSGLLNLGNVSPAFDLALCFVGGFCERRFAAQLDRAIG